MRVSALLLLLPMVAHARELPVSLSVERATGAEECATREELAQRVEDILHRALEPGTARGDMAIAVHFQRTPSGVFTARASATGPKPGQRLLRDSSPTCAALSEAVAVAIALLLDSAHTDAGEGASDTSLPAAPPSPVTPAEPDDPAEAVEPARPLERRALSARAALDVGGGYGLGGTATMVGSGRAGVRLGGWTLDAGVVATLPRAQSFEGGEVETSLMFGALRACYLLGRSFQLGPCAQLGVGRLRGEGSDFGEAQSSSLSWAAAGLGLAAEARLSHPLYLTFGTTLWVPSASRSFTVQNAGIAWESKPVAGVASVGLGLTLF